ncbi:MAG: amino acid adenylation domain-containing protein, partial [Cyanobacteria bacterium J06641_5]
MKAKNIADVYDLSPLQQGLLFHSLYEPDSGVYVDQHSIRLQGPLHLDRFQQAWQEALERHSILRTSFHWQKLKQPVQVVRQQVPLPWQFEDWSGIEPKLQASKLQAWLQSDRTRGFDLDRAPLFRISAIALGPQTIQIIFSRHHILMDGWSRMLLYKEIFATYQALIQDLPQPAFSAPSFRSYIHWIRQQEPLQAQQYWQQHLQGLTAPTRLLGETDTERSPAAPTGFQSQRCQLSATQTEALQTFARQHQLTLNTLVLAAWSILLGRFSGEPDVTFGVTSSGRPPQLAQSERIVGPLINTLPLRVQLSGHQPLLEWLQNFQARQVEIRQYEYCALTEIQAWSDMPAGSTLFESLAIFENYPVDRSLSSEDDSLQILDTEIVSYTHYPLTLYASGGEQLKLDLGYRCDRYDAAQIERYLQVFQQLLIQLPAVAERPLHALTGLSPTDRDLILRQWNQTQTPYPDGCIHHLFEQQAAQTPEAIAIDDLNRHLTYTDLDVQANRLSHYLQARGLGPEVTIGLALERSVDLVVAMLAILKAGGAYIPLDPSYPQARLEFMLQDAKAAMLLTESSTRDRFSTFPGQVLCLDDAAPAIAEESERAPATPLSPQNLAYIIYTSGSTGQPKGVAISHGAAVNFLHAHRRSPGLEADDILLAVTSLSFDIALLELILPLTVGARVLIASKTLTQDGPELARLTQQATTMQATPATWRLLLAAGWSGHANLKIFSGGEALTPELAEALLTKGKSLWNLYGPTETTVWSTQQQIIPSVPVDIGRPIANTEIYLLDRDLQLVPIGAPGELYIGGAGVARGYFNRPELTAERFLPNPFGEGTRLYRTGDLARYRPDGTLQHLGRMDDQVKVRGFRIELGEIEAALNQHPDIQQAVVVARSLGPSSTPDSANNEQLVAYCQPRTGRNLDTAMLKQELQQQLPAYMIPSLFVTLPTIPLTPNGKVNRRALPAPERAIAQQQTEFLPPQTETEQQLAQLWRALLSVEKIGLLDNFFDLGGHSILIVQLLTQIQETWKVSCI